mmetsp:Transcript_775/g.1351  ORF Transcript_775/g.1351 Transcript_775/m.1351 type:complete len:287 (+) Transcript_775:449-1309(+)
MALLQHSHCQVCRRHLLALEDQPLRCRLGVSGPASAQRRTLVLVSLPLLLRQVCGQFLVIRRSRSQNLWTHRRQRICRLSPCGSRTFAHGRMPSWKPSLPRSTNALPRALWSRRLVCSGIWSRYLAICRWLIWWSTRLCCGWCCECCMLDVVEGIKAAGPQLELQLLLRLHFVPDCFHSLDSCSGMQRTWNLALLTWAYSTCSWRAFGTETPWFGGDVQLPWESCSSTLQHSHHRPRVELMPARLPGPLLALARPATVHGRYLPLCSRHSPTWYLPGKTRLCNITQ